MAQRQVRGDEATGRDGGPVKLRQHVYDRWWPWRRGRIVGKGLTVVRVRWSDGEEWTYDKAHQQFLEAA